MRVPYLVSRCVRAALKKRCDVVWEHRNEFKFQAIEKENWELDDPGGLALVFAPTH
jgi:hypothetical protein